MPLHWILLAGYGQRLGRNGPRAVSSSAAMQAIPDKAFSCSVAVMA